MCWGPAGPILPSAISKRNGVRSVFQLDSDSGLRAGMLRFERHRDVLRRNAGCEKDGGRERRTQAAPLAALHRLLQRLAQELVSTPSDRRIAVSSATDAWC